MKNRIGRAFRAATPRALWSRLAPRRKPRPERAPEPSPVAELGRPLRAFRAAALWGLAILIATADGAAFTESYRGLYLWALHHNFGGFWAAAFPPQVDVFIIAGEVVLFVAMTDQWTWRERLDAWAAALLGLAVSVAGNIGHVHAHDLQSRATAAVPPLAAFGALWLGLRVLKRILQYRRRQATVAAESAQVAAERDALAVALDELSGAVALLAGKASQPVPAADESVRIIGRLTEQTSVLAELLDAVRDLGARPADAIPSPVPADAESAARIAMEATVAARNPLSLNQLQTRFGLTRAQATKVREAAGVTEPRLPALNGSGAGA